MVAAAAAPELLSAIPAAEHEGLPRFPHIESVHIIQTMLVHGHVDAAFDYLIHQEDPGSFPFFSVGAVLHHLGPQNPETAARRTRLLSHGLELWRHGLLNPDRHAVGLFRHHHHGFEGFFGHFWKDFPPDELLSIAHTIVEGAIKKPDSGTSSGYASEVRFTSRRQDDLFRFCMLCATSTPHSPNRSSTLTISLRWPLAGIRWGSRLCTRRWRRKQSGGRLSGQLARAYRAEVADTFCRATLGILTGNARSSTLLVTGTLRHPSKTRRKVSPGHVTRRAELRS